MKAEKQKIDWKAIGNWIIEKDELYIVMIFMRGFVIGAPFNALWLMLMLTSRSPTDPELWPSLLVICFLSILLLDIGFVLIWRHNYEPASSFQSFYNLLSFIIGSLVFYLGFLVKFYFENVVR